MQQQRLLGTSQNSSREQIALIATIYADRSLLLLALIYKAVSSNLQDLQLLDYNLQEYACQFASLPNRWTSNKLSLSQLQSLFYKQTVNKARRDQRLLILNSYSSYYTLNFLEQCLTTRIVVAVFPPYLIYTLQPLDVSLSRPYADFCQSLTVCATSRSATRCACRAARAFPLMTK